MDTITFDDFVKVDMRVGTITAAEALPKSKKLLKLSVSFGPEIGSRTILAGIAEAYDPLMIVGLQIVAVINLPPRSMMGIESNGMLLAGHTADGKLRLVYPNDIAEGERIG